MTLCTFATQFGTHFQRLYEWNVKSVRYLDLWIIPSEHSIVFYSSKVSLCVSWDLWDGFFVPACQLIIVPIIHIKTPKTFAVFHRYIWGYFRSNYQRCSLRKGVLRNFTKSTRKHLCQSLFFNKVPGLRPATLLKKMPWHRCFPVNFEKFLRTTFLQNTCVPLLIFFSKDFHDFSLFGVILRDL